MYVAQIKIVYTGYATVHNYIYFIFAASRLSSRRASDQWSRGYFRRRSSPSNLPIFPESGGQGKESPPVSHSSIESNSSGVGNDSPPVSTAVNLYPMFNNTTPIGKFAVIVVKLSHVCTMPLPALIFTPG